MGAFTGVITTAGAALIAGSIGGAALAITHIALGDGNGALINPAVGNTQLVHEVWRGAITAAGRDAANPAMWRFETEVPEAAGPFTIREIGLYANATLVAIARHPVTEKPLAVEGIATSLITEMAIPVSAAANVTVNFINDDAGVGLWRLLRAPFVSVNSATTTAPPGAPANGDVYLVPAAATGAWAGQTNKLAQWNGSIWTAFVAPTGTVVAAIDSGQYLKRTAGGWASFFSTTAQAVAGEDLVTAMSPAMVREVVVRALIDVIDHAFGGDPDYAATTAAAMALLAPIASPTFTGTPLVPSIASLELNTQQIPPVSWVQNLALSIAMNLIDHCLGGDPDFAATLSTRLETIEARLTAGSL